MTQKIQPKTIRNNNPFALIQKKPDKWQGLKSVDNGGFLAFNDVFSGLRAGMINLKNGYFKRGLNTPNKIVEKYLGAKLGELNNTGDSPTNYAASIKKIAGISGNEVINPENKAQFLALCKAIITVEAGQNWVKNSDLEAAYNVVFKGAKPPQKNGLAALDNIAGDVGFVSIFVFAIIAITILRS